MLKGLVFLTTILLTSTAGGTLASLNAPQKASSVEYIVNEDFESFSLDEKGVLNSAWNPDTYGLQSFSSAGESKGRIVSDGVDPYLELKYDGKSTASNSNAVLWNTNFSQGTGAYIIEFDIKCEGLSVGDNFLWTLYGPDYQEGGVTKYCNTGAISAFTDLASYNALPNSTRKAGYKTYKSNYVNMNSNWNFDTLRLDFYLHESLKTTLVASIDNISLKKGNVELLKSNDVYYGDFSPYVNLSDSTFLPSDGMEAKNNFHGFGSLGDQSTAQIIKEGSNQALKFAYVAGKSNYSSIYVFGEFSKAGLYTFEFDLKYSADAKAYDFGIGLAGPDPWGNPEPVKVANSATDLMNFDDSNVTGYKKVKVSIWLDNYCSKNVDSATLYYNTAGKNNDFIIIDNFKIYLEKAAEYPTITEDLTTSPYTSLLYLGDFEGIQVGTKFTNALKEETINWGSIYLDSPGVIKGDSTNKYVELRYDGTPSHHYASIYYALVGSKMFVNTAYKMSFDYKQSFVDGNTIGSKWHFSFVGTDGEEAYKCYLNSDPSLGYLANGRNFTNGMCEELYEFTVTEKGDGWLHFELLFYMDYKFITNANTFRFVYDTEKNQDNYVCIDNVEFGVYKDTQKPIHGFETGTYNTLPSLNNGWIIPVIIIGVALVLGGTTLVVIMNRRKKHNEK